MTAVMRMGTGSAGACPLKEMPRKLQDVSRMEALGWRAKIGMEDGIREKDV
jgi:nucleoside-diphosphate-sugar epimerase